LECNCKIKRSTKLEEKTAVLEVASIFGSNPVAQQCFNPGSSQEDNTQYIPYFVNPTSSTGIRSWNASWMYELLLAA
jgi:hypothetical protein